MALRGKLGWVLAASVFGVAPLSGCTTTIALQPPHGYLDFGYRGGEGRVVRVLTFDDLRTRGECPGDVTPRGSTVKGGSMIPSPEEQLRCSPDPPKWFADRLAAALQGAGYTVVGEDKPGVGDVLEVRGSLRSVTVEQLTMFQTVIFEADVSLELHASTPSGLSASRGFFVKASVSKMGGGMGTLQEMLDESSTRAVRDMTAAILSLTNRYPAVAPEPAVAESTATTPEGRP